MTDIVPFKEEDAYHLRMGGMSFDEIAERLSITTREAVAHYRHRQVELMRDVGLDTREQLQQMDLARLDAMMVPFYAAATQGDKEGAEVTLKIMAHRAKLLRLDQPMPSDEQVTVQTIVVTGSKEEFLEALESGRRVAGPVQDDGGEEEDS